jgi:hypothetical protein
MAAQVGGGRDYRDDDEANHDKPAVGKKSENKKKSETAMD